MNTLCSNWITDADLVNCDCPQDAAEVVVDACIEAASDWLFQQSGRRWPGICETAERPCGCGCGCAAYGTFPWAGTASDFDAWAHYYGGFGGWNDAGLCGCRTSSIIETTYGPISSVTSIVIGGSTLDPSKYVVIPPNRIMRIDGDAWPTCQDYTSPATGMIVTYRHGSAPPELGKRAAAELAADFVNACTDNNCKLPAGTTSVTRRNVTVNLDPDTASRHLNLVATFLNGYPKQTTQPDVRRPGKRGLITSGPATP